jgi:hypothetical protein
MLEMPAPPEPLGSRRCHPVMATFVHLTSESNLPLIQRRGLRLRGAMGVFAVPLTRDFYLSYQWVREMRRFRKGPLVGVYFRLPDTEPVLVGHYNEPHRSMTACEAVREFLANEPRVGWQTIILRPVRAREIHRTRRAPLNVGWRYAPHARGRPPCGCAYCQRGKPGARKIRTRWEGMFARNA